MTTCYQRIPLSETIAFSEILDPKLKTNSLRIQFLQPLSEKNASACALAGSLAVSSSKAYPTNAAMNRKLHLLYGADLSCTVSKQGDIQMITLHSSAIADRYALDGEAVFDELLEIMLGCLLQPNVIDDAFDEIEFRIQQANLLDSIDAEINEKRQYAIQQTYKTAFAGEPAAHSCYGSRETAAALTPTQVYAAFQTLLQTAQIEVYFVGPEAKPNLVQKLKSALASIPNRNAKSVSFFAPSPVKPEPVTVRESLPVNQCKMVMGWKTDCTDRFALKMMTLLLGGTPSSKLFANVREKMSLCYYCAANYVDVKQLLLVDCGIETENIVTTKTAIQDQLNAICNGEISNEEMQSTLMTIHNTLCGIGDTASSYINWYFSQFYHGTQLTPAEEEACYRRVTKEQIIAAAKSMQLDTIYIMECTEQEDATHGDN